MTITRALRSRGSESVTNWYCNSCSWSVTVTNGKPGELKPRLFAVEFLHFLSQFGHRLTSTGYSDDFPDVLNQFIESILLRQPTVITLLPIGLGALSRSHLGAQG